MQGRLLHTCHRGSLAAPAPPPLPGEHAYSDASAACSSTCSPNGCRPKRCTHAPVSAAVAPAPPGLECSSTEAAGTVSQCSLSGLRWERRGASQMSGTGTLPGMFL